MTYSEGRYLDAITFTHFTFIVGGWWDEGMGLVIVVVQLRWWWDGGRAVVRSWDVGMTHVGNSFCSDCRRSSTLLLTYNSRAELLIGVSLSRIKSLWCGWQEDLVDTVDGSYSFMYVYQRSHSFAAWWDLTAGLKRAKGVFLWWWCLCVSVRVWVT